MTLKMAVFAPIPSATVAMATAANAGDFHSVRTAYRRSAIRVKIHASFALALGRSHWRKVRLSAGEVLAPRRAKYRGVFLGVPAKWPRRALLDCHGSHHLLRATA